MTASETFDLIVIGGGTAGASAAYHAARAGVRTCVLERAPRDEAGARWLNAVPDWMFDAAGFSRPSGAESHGHDTTTNLFVGYGDACVRIDGHGLFDVDMRQLGTRLLTLAETAGADIRDGARVLHVEHDVVHTDHGTLRARHIVDASGLSGVRLFGAPTGIDICTAAQELRRVTDLAAAEAYVRRFGARPGEVLGFTAVEGSYSVLNVRVEGDHVSILTGSLASAGVQSGRQMLDAFVAEHTFVGERVFGGARAIPIGRPRDVLTRGGHAVVGDAAVQVFAAHGSGVGLGMIAGRYLGEAIASHDDPDPYAVRFHRAFGGLCAGYEVMRRFMSSATREELAWLMNEGLLSADMMRPGLRQEPAKKDPRLVPGFVRAARKRPALGARLLSALTRMLALEAMYRVYPSDPRRRAAFHDAARVLTERTGHRLVPWVLA